MPVTFMLDTGGAQQVPATPVNQASGGPAAALQPLVHFAVSFPDAYSNNVTFAGKVAPVVAGVLQPAVVMTGSPIALPAVPGAGTTFWALSVVLATGVVSMLTSSTGPPVAPAGNLILLQSQTKASDAIPWSSGVAAITSLGNAPTLLDLN